MTNILFITTVYRTGEKIYPIIPKLAKKYNVDVLNMYQMSDKTHWVNECDPRINFYNMCDKYCSNVVHGPAYVHNADIDSKNNSDFIKKIDEYLEKNYYDLVIWDNNVTTKGGKWSSLYRWFNDQNIICIGCPHGNREYRGYRIHKRIGRLYDYSFIFGKKEKRKLLSLFKGKLEGKLLLGGIPSNDSLKNYTRGNKYILIIPNFTDSSHIMGQTSHFSPFTKKLFERLRIYEMSREYNCDIIIKEKLKLFYPTDFLKNSLKKYKNVHCIDSHEDDNRLVADAKCVISASSTLAFKSVQMGIPTVILNKHGMKGNFYDYKWRTNGDPKEMRDFIEQQEKNGKDINFISDTLEGGLEFNSSDIYIDRIEKFLYRC